MLRADWQKRRLQRVEADLYRTVLAESPGNSLAAVLLAESPAAKLLIRVQRQIAAFERTWHRANNELRRARAEAQASNEGSFEKYLDFLCAKPAPRRTGFVSPIRKFCRTGLANRPRFIHYLATYRRKNRQTLVLRRLTHAEINKI
jgi:hypothetical protein